MCPPEIYALRDYLGAEPRGRTLSDARHEVSLTGLPRFGALASVAREMSGRSVLVATSRQLLAGLAMIELDGVARRILLCPPDLEPDRIPALLDAAEVEVIVTDRPVHGFDTARYRVVGVGLPADRAGPGLVTERATEWLMLTSGTSGLPKIVRHTLAGLAGAIIAEGTARHPNATWATFYDIRRYGGLQIFLRALIGGGSMVLSESGEALADYVARLRAGGVTHISGTPSHWRKLLMSGAASGFSPRYVRLSGEIADQAVLDGLAKTFPRASVGHAYASTEAGVGFSVDDGREGFPADLIGRNRDGVEMKVVDGSLCIRSPRTARAYVGAAAPSLIDADGFVDTGDIVELRGDRYHFVGRRGGIINIGGLKVHPEEIEAAINRHRAVRMSRARSRRSPITGSIVVADVVLAEGTSTEGQEAIRNEILGSCKVMLAAYKVPAVIRFVERLDVTPAGKLARVDA